MENNEKTAKSSVTLGIGNIIALVLTVALNHSFWWGCLHFLLGWFYVIYIILFRAKEIIPALKDMFL